MGKRMPEEKRERIKISIMDGMNNREAGDEYGIDESTVRVIRLEMANQPPKNGLTSVDVLKMRWV